MKKKLIFVREHISSLSNSHMNQVKGGTGFTFFTSRDNCWGISLCDCTGNCASNYEGCSDNCNTEGGTVGICPSFFDTCNSCGNNDCTGIMTK